MGKLDDWVSRDIFEVLGRRRNIGWQNLSGDRTEGRVDR